GVFTVTISNLEESDSGTYYCGVERIFKDTFHKVILKVLEAPTPTSRTTPRLSDWSTSKGTEARKIADSETSITMPVVTTTTANSSDKKQLIYIGAGLAALVLLFVIFLFILIKQSKRRKAAVQQTEKAQHTENVVKYSSAKTSSVNQTTILSIQDTPMASRGSHSDPSSTVYANFTPSHDALSYATVSFANQSDDLNYSNVIFVKESDANTSHSKKSDVDTARSSSPLYATVNPTNTSHSDQDTNAVVYSTVQKVE
ncbi:hypothetical protein MHYP_G00103410, partial [Metynnis hypsauchen]